MLGTRLTKQVPIVADKTKVVREHGDANTLSSPESGFAIDKPLPPGRTESLANDSHQRASSRITSSPFIPSPTPRSPRSPSLRSRPLPSPTTVSSTHDDELIKGSCSAEAAATPAGATDEHRYPLACGGHSSAATRHPSPQPRPSPCQEFSAAPESPSLRQPPSAITSTAYDDSAGDLNWTRKRLRLRSDKAVDVTERIHGGTEARRQPSSVAGGSKRKIRDSHKPSNIGNPTASESLLALANQFGHPDRKEPHTEKLAFSRTQEGLIARRLLPSTYCTRTDLI